MRKIRLLCVILATLSVGSLLAQTHMHTDDEPQERIIKADFRKEKGKLNTSFKECVGAGRANEGLRADWQQQLAIAKKECGFTYIRMHGLLTDDMGVYKEDGKGNPSYNYQYIDVLYDYILSIGMKPFVELGFMPNALASGSQAIFWWRGNTTPPKDYAKWEALIRNLTLHFTERYGPQEVKTWYFEVWNEPNLSGFWAGTQQDYFKLYASSVKAIKSVNTAYRVGGPATAGAAWVPEMIDFCSTNALPLDFISTRTYGVKQGFLDEFGTSGTVLNKNVRSVSGDMLNSRKQILNSPMPGLELHYTEWSSSYTPSDPIHDSYHEASYILEEIKQAGNAVNSMSYWTFTDIFEEAGPRFTPFHGGFGLLNYQGIKKPAFYSFSFLNKLGNTELANADSSSWVCKNAKGDIQVLYWDFTNTLPDSTNNQQYYIRDLPSKPKGKVKVEIAGIPEGSYRLEIYKVGYKANDPYTTYLTMNRPNQLTRQQVDHIKQQNDGSPVSTENITVKADGTFSSELSTRENDVFLLNLIKTPPVSITVNLLQDQGNLPPIWEFFGYDEANYTYMKDGRKLLTELAALSPVRVNVRTHNLLTSGNGTPGLKWSSTNAYTEDATGQPVYDWKIIDSIFDTYVQRGMKPIAEIGFMPEALSVNPGSVSEQDTSNKSRPKHYSGWAYPPKSYEKWAELIFQWVKHSVQRYGKAEVEGWYWEVWNEPDLNFYWKGSVDDYIKLYDYTADAVKRALPAAKIGGPETTSPDGRSGGEYIRKFLTHVVSGTNYVTGKKGAPLDFISFHAKGSPKLIDAVVWMNMGNQLRSIDKGFEIVSSIPSLKNLPIIIGESDPEGCAACSEDLHPENAYRNNTMYACYTAAAIARTYDLAKKWGVTLAGAVTWGFEFEDQPYFRGFRDLATNGIDKPVLNVFRMLGMMQGTRVATESTSKQNYITVRDSSVRGPEPDVNTLATKSKNSAAVIVWNYHDKNDLNVAPTDVSLMIKGLPQQRVLLTQYIIDQEHSNSFTAWKKMGSPKEPTADEYKTLEAAGQLDEISSPKYITPVNGEVKINFDLPRQAITLLKVSW
jgi:xylan 1,4-beta-xylosidase